MKKAIIAIVLTASSVIFTPISIFASIDDVNTFLAQYAANDNAFHVEEFSGEDFEGTKRNSLVVRTDLASVNIDPATTDDIFTEMASQEWFDYTDICSINVNSEIGNIPTTTFYNVSTGTRISCSSEHPSSMRFPWLVKNEDDLSDDERRFLLRIAQELLQGTIDTSLSLDIGAENECDCSIKECNGLVEISGVANLDSIDYNFTVQFTYETTDYQDGTYNELYLGVNNIDMFGTNVKFEYRTYEK